MEEAIKVNDLHADIKKVVRRIDKVLSKVKDPKKKREILTKAALPIVKKAQNLTPVGKPRGGVLKGAVSATYKTPKLVGSMRAKRGQGVISGRYYPMNLKRSIRVLNLKKTANVFVGPRILRKANRKSYGKSDANANAYYAQIIFGSAIAFRKKIMLSALRAMGSSAAKIATIEARKEITKEAKKQRLD